MSHSPPIPQGNQSPYPIQEPPHVPAAKLPPVARSEASPSIAARAVNGATSLPLIAIGAIVGLGTAVFGGVMLASRRGKKGK